MESNNDYLVYILKCGDGTLYTGITNDLAKRLNEHEGGKKGAKYTRGRGPFLVVYQEGFFTKGDALRRELEIKAMSRDAKDKLIAQKQDEDIKKIQDIQPGTLYLCATPIGNLEDMTYRAVKTLQQVDIIAAEDTRHTRKLLTHFDIHVPLTSYHEHNKQVKGPKLIEELFTGKSIAVVTDAGLPGISDPGQDLVTLAVEAGIRVIPIPGASAGITALIVSGFSTNRFAFEGFLPSQLKARERALLNLVDEERTMIFYEAPHRLTKTLTSMAKVLGSRQIAVVRELTKRYEEVRRGNLPDVAAYYQENEAKGEFCLVVEGQKNPAPGLSNPETGKIDGQKSDPVSLVASLIAKGLEKKEAIKEGAKILGVPKREVYNAVVNQEQK